MYAYMFIIIIHVCGSVSVYLITHEVFSQKRLFRTCEYHEITTQIKFGLKNRQLLIKGIVHSYPMIGLMEKELLLLRL